MLLRTCEWHGSNDRLVELCKMLVINDVCKWYQLGRCGVPDTWPGAQRFSASELQVLRTLRSNGEQEPRHVLHPLCERGSSSLLVHRSPMPKKPRLVQGLQGGTLKSFDFDFSGSQQCGSAAGPRSALKLLASDLGSAEETSLWVERATMEAILGGMRLSLTSLKSGLNCYIAFVGTRPCSRARAHTCLSVLLL